MHAPLLLATLLLSGASGRVDEAQATNANGVWNHLRVEIRGDRMRVRVNGEVRLERTDARSARPRGGIALPAYTGGVGQCTVYYDNVIVTKLD